MEGGNLKSMGVTKDAADSSFASLFYCLFTAKHLITLCFKEITL